MRLIRTRLIVTFMIAKIIECFSMLRQAYFWGRTIEYRGKVGVGAMVKVYKDGRGLVCSLNRLYPCYACLLFITDSSMELAKDSTVSKP
jgi:hypothetical protein